MLLRFSCNDKGALDSRLESPTKIFNFCGARCAGMTRESVFVPAGHWIPACAGMTRGVRFGARCAGMTRESVRRGLIRAVGSRLRGNDGVRVCPCGALDSRLESPTKIFNFCGARYAGMTRGVRFGARYAGMTRESVHRGPIRGNDEVFKFQFLWGWW